MNIKHGIIYFASNKINDMVYIGQTIEKLNKRIQLHLTKNKNLYFSNTLNKYSKEGFNYGCIEYPIEKLNEIEIYWIKKLNTKYPNGYNLTAGGRGGRGYKFTKKQRKHQKITHNRPEVRKRISESMKISHNRPEVKKRISKSHKILWKNPEYRKRHSEEQKITMNRPEVKKRCSESHKILWKNPEYRKRIIEAQKISSNRPEVRKRISESLKIAMNKPETKKRNSEAQKIAWENPEIRKKIIKSQYKYYIFTDPDKKEYLVDNGFNRFCKEHNILYRSMSNVLKGEIKHHKGWKVENKEKHN